MSTATLPFDRRGLAVLCTAHVVNDLNQSAIPALLPFLIVRDHLSLASAAALILAMNLSSSVVQPFFGYWSDRRSLAWVMPVAVLLACASTASLGWLHSYPAMFVAAMIAGLGVAAFHPEGSRYANYCSGSRRATGMSIFSLGGYGGFALGPIIITPVLLTMGLHGSAVLVIPGLLMLPLFAAELPRLKTLRTAHSHHLIHGARDDWRSFWWLAGVVSLRSTVFFGIVTFLPLFAIHALHANTALGNAMLTSMLLAGIFGTLLGGRLADLHDRRAVVAISIATACVLCAALAAAGALHAALWIAFVLAALLGFCIALSASVLVVIGQELLPTRIGIASGVTLGLAVSVGGIGAPLYGAIGDHAGLPAVFAAIAIVAAAALAGTAMLPRSSPHGIATFAEAEEAAV